MTIVIYCSNLVTQNLNQYFYVCKFTPYIGTGLLWVPLLPETNGYIYQVVLSIIFIAKDLAFSILSQKKNSHIW